VKKTISSSPSASCTSASAMSAWGKPRRPSAPFPRSPVTTTARPGSGRRNPCADTGAGRNSGRAPAVTTRGAEPRRPDRGHAPIPLYPPAKIGYALFPWTSSSRPTTGTRKRRSRGSSGGTPSSSRGDRASFDYHEPFDTFHENAFGKGMTMFRQTGGGCRSSPTTPGSASGRSDTRRVKSARYGFEEGKPALSAREQIDLLLANCGARRTGAPSSCVPWS
jgi:hypothetical protein